MYDVYNTFYNDIKIWSFALRIFFMHILLLRILTTRYSSKIRNNNQHWEFWLVVLIMIGWSDSIYRSKSDRIESQSAGTRVTAISLRIRARIELVRAWRPNLAWISRDWMSKSELHNAWEERDFLVETRNEGNTRKKRLLLEFFFLSWIRYWRLSTKSRRALISWMKSLDDHLTVLNKYLSNLSVNILINWTIFRNQES